MTSKDLLQAMGQTDMAYKQEAVTALFSGELREMEESNMNRKTYRRIGRTLLIAAIVALALATAAAASGVLGHIVNMRGEVIGEEVPSPAATSEPSQNGPERRQQEIIAAADSETITIASYSDENGVTHVSGTGKAQELQSLEELHTLLTAQGSPLRVPANAPEGYILRQVQVSYECAADYDYELISSETDEYGVTTEQYVIPEDGKIIGSYMLEYVNDSNDRVLVTGSLSSAENVFVMEEGDSVKTVEIEGMDDACVQERNGTVTLHMQAFLDEPVAYTGQDVLRGARPTAEGDFFDRAVYTVCSDSLDADQLLALFE